MAPQPALAASSRAAPVREPAVPETLLERRSAQQMESPTFLRRATDVGRTPPAVPTTTPSGVGNPPVNPALAEQYVREANARIAGAAAPEATAGSGGAVTKSGRNVADILREGERVMGRPLSAEEKDAVLQRLFGKRTSHPGHPYWLGPGAPTE